MEFRTIEEQIALGKSSQFDFFPGLADLNLIFNTISAFANSNGGIIVIGVRSNKKIVGVNPAEVIRLINIESKKHLLPSFDFELNSLAIGRHLVVCIHITNQSKKIGVITKDRNDFYIREESQTVIVSKIHKIIWKEPGKSIIVTDDFKEELDFIRRLVKSNGQISLSKLYKSATMKNSLVDKLVAREVMGGNFDLVYKNKGWLIQCLG